MKCDACGFFDCGNDCRCRCHPHDKDLGHDETSPTPTNKYSGGDERGVPTRKVEEEAMEGLSRLFG